MCVGVRVPPWAPQTILALNCQSDARSYNDWLKSRCIIKLTVMKPGLNRDDLRVSAANDIGGDYAEE